ncbi:alpha/beta hydrolase [Sphingomonas sp. CGMCC 1.13654]|uniref:Alpha/beta hydrolase n=2 Tax=Sphingomonas chungangi TaxID=2683589 RepID=A0A838L4M6_9SPHN|nr:alpha/beta hydrolase [Sphingomonas chungangi]
MRMITSATKAHDEEGLLKATTRRPTAGHPPPHVRRKVDVRQRTVRGRPVYTLSKRGAAANAGHLLYWCGGAYCHPPAFLHWYFVAALVDELGITCTVPLYPLAPEHSCAEGIAFASGIYRDLLAEYGADQLYMGGDSAGGGLAVATWQAVGTKPARLVLIAPWLDAGASDPSQSAIERYDWLMDSSTIRTWGKWWAHGRPLDDPLVSPLFGDLSDFPRALLICGTRDILVADARRLAAIVPERIRYIEVPGLMHAYPLLTWIPESRRVREEIGAFFACERSPMNRGGHRAAYQL